MKTKKILAILALALAITSFCHAENEEEEWGDFKWSERLNLESSKNGFSEIPASEINTKDKYGCTPLYYALSKGVETVQMLIDAGADVNLKCDEYGNPPIIAASGFWNFEEVAKCLVLNNASLSCRDKNKNTARKITIIGE